MVVQVEVPGHETTKLFQKPISEILHHHPACNLSCLSLLSPADASFIKAGCGSISETYIGKLPALSVVLSPVIFEFVPASDTMNCFEVETFLQ